MSLVNAVLGVFSSVGEWFVEQMQTVLSLFVTVTEGASGDEYQLTFFGIMTLVSIGLAVIMLLIRTVGDFLGMRR